MQLKYPQDILHMKCHKSRYWLSFVLDCTCPFQTPFLGFFDGHLYEYYNSSIQQL